MKEESKKNKRVLLAMSGGVDSSVAALLLKEQGFEVIGITLKLFCYGKSSNEEKKCCSLSAVNDARAVCEELGIPHYVFSAEKEFEKEIVNNFISEYQQGRTPSPCIRCNQLIKFSFLIKKAEELGASFVATGHYSRIERAAGNFILKKSTDLVKDQSYFLYRLGQEVLSKTLFPVGDLTKKEVREIAKKKKVYTAERTESQEACFIEKGKIKDFLKDRLEVKEGDIVDKAGKVLGKHEGIFLYTIGQRKGVGGGYKEPMYVVGIDTEKNQVIIGPSSELDKKIVQFDESSWVSGQFPEGDNLQAKIRSSMAPVPVKILRPNEAVFAAPVKAVTPGQSIVFYREDVCLGGGIII